MPMSVGRRLSHIIIAAAFGSLRCSAQIQLANNPSGPVIAFAPTAIGSSSASQSIQLKLTQAVSISSIGSPVSAGGVQEYAVGAVTGCVVDGTTVNAAGTVCVVPVVFQPGYPGNRAIPLQVATSGGNVNFGMNGRGTGPLAVLAPGLLSTVAGGGGSAAVEGGAATAAQLLPGKGVAIDNQGNLYFGSSTSAGYVTAKIYRVDAKTGAITTYAGVAAPAAYSGDGGAALSAKINSVSYLAFDAAGNLYFSDTADCTVREIVAATGIIQTVAGTLPDIDNYPARGYTGDGGPAVQAKLNGPAGLAIDAAGNLLIADQGNSVIRRVDAVTGNISTIAGTTQGYLGTGGPALSAQLNQPSGIALDTAGNLYIAEPNNAWVRRVDAVTGILSLVAGTGSSRYGADGGLATSTTLVRPTGVAVDPAGNVYITDLDLVSQSNAGAGSVTSTGRVREVSAATGVISTLAGGGAIAGAAAGQVGGDGSVATSATLAPAGVALDSAGKIYISDQTSEEERSVSASTSAMVFPTCTQSCPPVLAEQVLLSNIGNGPLSLTAPTVGVNPSYSNGWTQDSSSGCQQIAPGGAAYLLAAGANCSLVVDLNPASPPSGSGVLTLADTSLNGASTQTVALVPSTIAAGTTITSLSASFLTSYPGPVYGTSVTLMASVEEELPLSGHQTSGTVTFYSNGAAIAAATNVPVTNGIAKVAVTTFNAGDTSVTATYTPAMGNGLLASNAAPLTVTLGKAYANIGYSNSTSKSSYVYDGQPHGYTFFTIPAGLNFTVSYTGYTVSYSSSPNPPTEPGTYDQLGTIVDPNYTGYTDPLFTITKIPATVTLGGLRAANDGQPHSATATTVPAGLNVTFTYDGSATPPSSAGSHTVMATINEAHYSGTATGTLIIGNQQAATVTLGSLSATYDGNPHPVTVTTVPAGLATSVTYSGYNGPVSVPVAAGSYAVAANITDPAYTGSASAVLTIAQAQLQITFGNLSFTYDGNPHVPSTTTVPAGYQVTLIYDYPSGASSTPPTAPGTYTVVATAGDNNYTGFASTSMTILAATGIVPTITWSPSTRAVAHRPLGAGILDAVASAPGTFTYSASLNGAAAVAITNGTQLAAGSYVLTASFVPTDPTAYQSASATISLVVQPQSIFFTLSGGGLSFSDESGAVQGTTGTGGGIGAAVDASGNVWSIDPGGASLSKFSSAGVLGTGSSGAGVSGAALAIDGASQVWVANANGTLSTLSNAGVLLWTTTESSIAGTTGIAIDVSGSVWVANRTTNTVDEVIGAAAPAAPLATAVLTSTPGAKP